MTADVRTGTPVTTPSALSRIYGFGSVFGKTLRDSRRATIVVGGFIGLLLLIVASAITSQFATPESRQQIGDLVEAVPPIMQGMAGRPVNVESLGGYIQYKYGGFFPLVTALWSILALSGTLAAEVRRGSMEIVAASALTRRQIALQKLVGHILVMTLAMAVTFLAAVVVGSSLAQLPGDEIPVQAALGYALWLGLMALVAGGLAFALAPFVGRGSAAGIAGAVMFGGFILNGYQTAIPELAPFANLTWFGWTTNHLPLAGQYDWASLALVAVVTIVLFAIGIEAFARRDLGQTTALPTPGLPRALLGLRGPAGRFTGELLPTAVAWGIGLGFFGLVMGSSSRAFVEQLASSEQFSSLIASIFPGVDVATAGGFLQLVFVEFGLILAGLAAATLVGSWASDETSGRTEMLLAAPLARVRWAIAGGVAVFAGIVVLTALTAAGIALGAISTGSEVATPVLGTLVLGLYALGLAGVGIAVGGLFGARFAAPTVALLTILTWLFDFLGPALDLPDVVAQLALSSHMGMPMVGVWDAAGVVACLVLAAGGLALGAWGMHRRDLGA